MNSVKDDQDMKSELALQALFEQASSRLAPPAEDERQIRAAIHAEWSQLMGKRRRNRRFGSWALAASVLLAVFLTLNTLRTPQAPATTELVATIERQKGDVGFTAPVPTRVGVAQIFTGQTITTGTDSAVALAWIAGGSLRLDEETELLIVSASEVMLLSGRLYFDSMPGIPAPVANSSLTVTTTAGVVRHVGTQFMTEILDQSLTVNVREGVVAISGSNYNGQATAGQRIAILADGSVEIDARPGYGPDWQWVESIAPPLSLDGLTILEFLNWVSRESGRTLIFESPTAQAIAASELMRGNSGEADPIRALRIFLQTTDLQPEIVDDVISIRLAASDE